MVKFQTELTDSTSMRPTTKDLAKAAGVSLATVDRVLNARPGVRKKTVDAVNQAIKDIGFERNQLAAALARQRGYRFGFVLPRDGDEFLYEILRRIKEVDEIGRAEMITVECIRVDESDPHKAAQSLAELNAQDYDGIAIMAPETPQMRDAIRRMRERGIETISFIANQVDDGKENFVGIDNRAAGATAGKLMGRFTWQSAGSIAVITETMQSRDSLERRLGFDYVIDNLASEIKVLPSVETHGEEDRTFKVIKNTIESHRDLIGIYLVGSEARVPLLALEKYKKNSPLLTIAHERTPSTVAALKNGKLDAVVTQDTGHLVRSAVRILRAKCEKRTTLASQERIRIEILVAENL